MLYADAVGDPGTGSDTWQNADHKNFGAQRIGAGCILAEGQRGIRVRALPEERIGKLSEGSICCRNQSVYLHGWKAESGYPVYVSGKSVPQCQRQEAVRRAIGGKERKNGSGSHCSHTGKNKKYQSWAVCHASGDGAPGKGGGARSDLEQLQSSRCIGFCKRKDLWSIGR